jgi:hypothetical protein
MSRERLLATGQTGIAPFPMPLVRLVAASELLGAVSLIVPCSASVDSGRSGRIGRGDDRRGRLSPAPT